MALQMNAGETFDDPQAATIEAHDLGEERRILDEPINGVVRGGCVRARSFIPVRAVNRQVLVHQPSIAAPECCANSISSTAANKEGPPARDDKEAGPPSASGLSKARR